MNDRRPTLLHMAVRWLKWLDAPIYIVGDFVEEFEDMARGNGRFWANYWLMEQLIGSTPTLCHRRWQTMIASLTKRDKQLLILSVLMLIPAMLVGVPGVIFSVFGVAAPMNTVFETLRSSVWLEWLINPLVVIGGIGLAFLLTAWPVVQLDFNNKQDQFVGSLTIRKGYWLHLGVLGTAVLFMLTIFIYLFAENIGFF